MLTLHTVHTRFISLLPSSEWIWHLAHQIWDGGTYFLQLRHIWQTKCGGPVLRPQSTPAAQVIWLQTAMYRPARLLFGVRWVYIRGFFSSPEAWQTRLKSGLGI